MWDDLCGYVLNVNISDDKASSLASKSKAGSGSGVGQKSTLETSCIMNSTCMGCLLLRL